MSGIDYRRELIGALHFDKHVRMWPYEVVIKDPPKSDTVDLVIQWLNSEVNSASFNCRMYYSAKHELDVFVIWFTNREDALTCKLQWGGQC